jgi:predicted O-linked N-acetylglucosamine transferase (SPINDLY family)
MDPFMYVLAFARLAPVQFTTWGHPVTTGMPNMDYFLSHAKVEPADGARRYTEKLVLFENLPSYYYRPRGATEADMRERLGIAREARLYACPQTLIKFHPDFDDAVGALLRRDPRGLLLLVENGNASWNRKLQARMARTAPDLADRIRFVPAMPLPDFFALQRQADALLDTFHFGGGCSSYEALSAGAPVVTLPGASMRARVTLGWYELLGERTWVARDTEEFVELAYRLANDRDAREASRRRIGEGLGALVENDAVVRELERFVERAVEEAR